MESITITQVNIHELEAIIEGAVRKALKANLATKSSTSDREMITVPQAAEFLHLSVPTIYGLLHRRELPSLKRGKRVYFKKADLMRYLEEGRRNALPPVRHKRNLSTSTFKKGNKS
jgi:excisionase family DNA binding protein